MRRLPLLDSPAHAERCRALLDLPAERARSVADDTMRVLEAGEYAAPSGETVSLAAAIRDHRAAKQSFPPSMSIEAPTARRFGETTTWVSNAPTLTAARAFTDRGIRPAVLNFANGVTPGGGFLHGARAQEETLCFASTLYTALVGDPMYDAHAAGDTLRTSSWILRCDATVFRDAHHARLATPWAMTVLTCAAPICNPSYSQAGNAVATAEGAALLGERIDRVLDLAADCGDTHLVLGAWGCGAFRNDPDRIAERFLRAIERLDGAFDEVVFAISDWSPQRRFLGPFTARFATPAHQA
jgi:uncharacterized protein (TIGR02452 family)